MPKFIVKIEDKYLEWSTIVDAPVTWAMTRDEMVAHLLVRYGTAEADQIPARLDRADETGTSHFYYTLDEVGCFNRAGENESHLPLEKILDAYARPPEP